MPQEDQAGGARISARFQEWLEHWQVGQEALNQERPWECLELREYEEAVPLIKVRALRTGAAMCKTTM